MEEITCHQCAKQKLVSSSWGAEQMQVQEALNLQLAFILGGPGKKQGQQLDNCPTGLSKGKRVICHTCATPGRNPPQPRRWQSPQAEAHAGSLLTLQRRQGFHAANPPPVSILRRVFPVLVDCSPVPAPHQTSQSRSKCAVNKHVRTREELLFKAQPKAGEFRRGRGGGGRGARGLCSAPLSFAVREAA